MDRTLPCVMFTLLVMALPLGAQDAIGPGSALLRPGAPTGGDVSYDLLLIADGRASLTASVVRTLIETDWEGHPAILLVQRYSSPEGAPTNVDSSWVSTRDLRPLEYRARVGAERQRLGFGPDGARGTVVTPDSTRRVTHPAAAGAFNSVTEDLVIAALPLAPGFAADLLLYSPARDTATVSLVVEAREELPTAAGPTSTWRVRYEARVTSWFWIDPATRQLVRSRTQLPNGSEFWRVASRDVPAWREAHGVDAPGGDPRDPVALQSRLSPEEVPACPEI